MFNWLDVVIIFVVLTSTVLGACRGLVRESLSVVGWAGGFCAGLLWYKLLAGYLRLYGLTNELIAQTVAFLLLVCAVVVTASCVSWFLSSRIKSGYWLEIDRLLGAVFGGLRGAAIMALLVLLLARTNLVDESWCQQSFFTSYLLAVGDAIQEWFPKLYQLFMGILNREAGMSDEGVLA